MIENNHKKLKKVLKEMEEFYYSLALKISAEDHVNNFRKMMPQHLENIKNILDDESNNNNNIKQELDEIFKEN